MAKSSSMDILIWGAVLIVVGLLLLSPIPKVLGYVGIVGGAVLLIVGLVRVFTK